MEEENKEIVKSMSLYEIKNEMMSAFESFLYEEISQEEARERVKIISEMLQKKSNNIVAFVRQEELTIANIKEEIDRLNLLKKSHENKLNKFKEYVKENMQDLKLKKIDTSLGTLSIAKNPLSIEILDENVIPKKYKKEVTTYKIDKAAIKKDFTETGEIIEGIKIIADKTSLRIK